MWTGLIYNENEDIFDSSKSQIINQQLTKSHGWWLGVAASCPVVSLWVNGLTQNIKLLSVALSYTTPTNFLLGSSLVNGSCPKLVIGSLFWRLWFIVSHCSSPPLAKTYSGYVLFVGSGLFDCNEMTIFIFLLTELGRTLVVGHFFSMHSGNPLYLWIVFYRLIILLFQVPFTSSIYWDGTNANP